MGVLGRVLRIPWFWLLGLSRQPWIERRESRRVLAEESTELRLVGSGSLATFLFVRPFVAAAIFRVSPPFLFGKRETGLVKGTPDAPKY